MTAEMLGTLISASVAFSGLAALFLLANVAFKAMGLGSVFMRPEDHPARRRAEADSDTVAGKELRTDILANLDPVQPEDASLKPPQYRSVSELAEAQVAAIKADRLTTGLRRARLLATVVIFGLSLFPAVSHIRSATPNWAKACGWQLTGSIEIESAADRAAAIDRRLDDMDREARERTELLRRVLNESGPSEAGDALGLSDGSGVPYQAVEADPDYTRERFREARLELYQKASPRIMAWLNDRERSCWSVTEIRLQASGIAVLPALAFFVMTFILVRLGRWVLVWDQPR